ncbi:galactose mutarotase [Staphylococcus sp. SQ8-PEA]|uniref:Galactose mutarotase n=1 Tax=Staphylococcus marylandisciuri TaxID=2981529 RepID=A0ABT2QMN8_9STAP|nr:aldose epimerase family protein [Staphylococcus marylandisciuri]MCU5745238.1 galactose mutarotase [Staphylococcus marylandisciuri]
MFADIEEQSNGLVLIKVNSDEDKIVFTNYGARIVSWKYDDNNIVLGNAVEADEFYQANPFKFGATVGRYGGRIENARFDLQGQCYQLEKNDGSHHLHGGSRALDTKYFDYEVKEEANRVKIIFTTQLKSEEDGYPGDIDVKVIHTYDMEHRWTIEYKAVASATTLFNPLNHVYFNLNKDNNMINNHSIVSDQLSMYPLNKSHMIASQAPLNLSEVFEDNEIAFDSIFKSNHTIIKEQIQQFNGLDHPFILDKGKMTVENKNFSLTVTSDMPNVVIYTLNDSKVWKHDFNIYKPHSGFTLETQFLPNDINMYGNKAKSILEAEKPFYSKTTYQILKK